MHIIHSNTMDHLDNNTMLSDFQHGFHKKRSCYTQLIQTAHNLAKCLNDGEQIDTLLLHFSKAFDKVPHARLEAKLSYYGIRGNTQQWIKCSLSQRSQQVVLEGKPQLVLQSHQEYLRAKSWAHSSSSVILLT